ncbi:MAG TPA: DUF3800 domain-containing protein [Candidatus Saccharimonadales bacterium]|nr:DUF3800 domain-containing protein [Candidatus Saccharimonadales bacterium]
MKNLSTLYIDESGKSSLLEKAEEPFILTGVILEETEKSAIEGFFNYIKLKYGINPAIPFHSYDIFENPQSRLTDTQLASLAEKLADFISLIPIKVHIAAINKRQFKSVLGITSDNDFKGSREKKEMTEYPYRVCACILFRWFAKSLKSNTAIGEIIVDARRGGDYQLVKTLYASKQINNGYMDAESARLIADKCTAICFAEKRFLSGGLELTDLISYVAFFHARRKMSSMSRVKLDLIWGEVKKKLYRKNLDKVSDERIRNFFRLNQGEVHKYLK